MSDHTPVKPDSEKLQKVLARAGLGSRREMERWIADGRVKVNAKKATLGDRVVAKDRIDVDGKSLLAGTAGSVARVIIYNKPEGEICTRSDEKSRRTVFENLPPLTGSRWISVGRLDLNSSGLLLFTTDGELANRLMHPSAQVEREYAVRVLGEVDGLMMERLMQGVRLDDGMARFDQITDAGGRGANHWYHVIVREGRNREVRRLWESQGVQVSRLIRIRFGTVELPPRLKPGTTVDLTDPEINNLRQAAGLPVARKKRKPGAARAGKKTTSRRQTAAGKQAPARKPSAAPNQTASNKQSAGAKKSVWDKRSPRRRSAQGKRS